MLSSYPQDNAVLKIRIISEEIIDKSQPWGFFDCSAIGNPKMCGAEGILFFTVDHFITFKDGLGVGTNNLPELYALKLLLILSLNISRLLISRSSVIPCLSLIG